VAVTQLPAVGAAHRLSLVSLPSTVAEPLAQTIET
jgi:hypothetical protein